MGTAASPQTHRSRKRKKIMKTKKLYLLSLMLLGLFVAESQTLSSSVISVAGGYEKTPSGMSLSWTIGEPIVDPLRSGNVVLTQGFQQPDLKISTAFTDPGFEASLSVYPNPTLDYLQMETDYARPIQFRLMDISGKRINEGIWSQKHAVDVRALSAGPYAIYFIVEDRMVKSVLINKH